MIVLMQMEAFGMLMTTTMQVRTQGRDRVDQAGGKGGKPQWAERTWRHHWEEDCIHVEGTD